MAIVGTVQHVDELLHTRVKLENQGSSTSIEVNLGKATDEALKKFRIDGLDIAPKDARQRIGKQLAAAYDQELRQGLLQFDADWKATRAALEKKIADSRKAPAAINDAREVVLLRRWEGRTMAQLAAAYETSDDPTFIRMIESELETFGDLNLFKLAPAKTSLDEVAAIRRVQTAIDAKQTARQDAEAVKLLGIMTEKEQQPFLNLSHLMGLAKTGRNPFTVAQDVIARAERGRVA